MNDQKPISNLLLLQHLTLPVVVAVGFCCIFSEYKRTNENKNKNNFAAIKLPRLPTGLRC